MGFKGIGHYETNVILLSFESGRVQALLPKGLTLANLSDDLAPLFPNGEHPILFTLGAQTDVHPSFTNLIRMNYLEASANIPFVCRTNDAAGRPRFYTTRIYLTKLMPLIMGLFYGLPKVRADMGMSPSGYAVNDHGDCGLILSARLESAGPEKPVEGYPLFDQAIRKMLEEVVISKLLGFFLCFGFDWKFDNATIEPITASLTLKQPFRTGAPTGTFSVRGIDESPLGALRLKTPWQMGLPGRCSRR